MQANIRIRTITRICGDRWSIFAQVILTLLILSCAAQYVLCSHCCYNCHQTSWMDLASFGPYAMHFWKIMFFRCGNAIVVRFFFWHFVLSGLLLKKQYFGRLCFFRHYYCLSWTNLFLWQGASFRNFLENWAMRLIFQVTNVSGFISIMNWTFLW